MHKKRRMEHEWPIVIVDNEKKHREKYKNSRIELKCATMTVEKESNVYVMHKKSNGAQILNIDCSDCEQCLNIAPICKNDG